MAKSLNGTKTHQNLKDAFAGESQANRRYLYFAQQADIEGLPEIAGNFKETADGETGHAHGHLKYLAQVGDPATGLPPRASYVDHADFRRPRPPVPSPVTANAAFPPRAAAATLPCQLGPLAEHPPRLQPSSRERRHRSIGDARRGAARPVPLGRRR